MSLQLNNPYVITWLYHRNMITGPAHHSVCPTRILLMSGLHGNIHDNGFSFHILSKSTTSLPMKIRSKFNRPTLILQPVSKDMILMSKMQASQSGITAQCIGPQEKKKSNVIKMIFHAAQESLCRREEYCGKGQRKRCYSFIRSENNSPSSILQHIKYQ